MSNLESLSMITPRFVLYSLFTPSYLFVIMQLFYVASCSYRFAFQNQKRLIALYEFMQGISFSIWYRDDPTSRRVCSLSPIVCLQRDIFLHIVLRQLFTQQQYSVASSLASVVNPPTRHYLDCLVSVVKRPGTLT